MALATIVLSAFGARRWDWVRDMEDAFRSVLGPLELHEVVRLALLSGVSEEMLFRGATQPLLVHALRSEALGLLAASAVFALVHFPPRRELWPWPPFAFALGLFFGYVTLASGNLLPAVVCHAAINAVNLRRITRPIVR
jgi:membrane protease YdiL (CAAX protease family)